VLDVYWHDTVTVEYDYLPVNNSLVEVFDNANSIVTSGVTDDSGQVLLAIKEFTQGPATMLNYTPHILKATKSGYPNGTIESNVTCTKSDTIVLGEEVYIPGQPMVIFGDWIINNSVSHSNKTIIVDNGNVIIENGGSLSLNNTLLQLRYTTSARYKIEVQDGGSLFLYDSNVAPSYPELNIYYNFRNYGYLNMQNCTVNKANSIYFYDSSDDSSVICNSTIKDTASYGIYADHASPTIRNNFILRSGSYGLNIWYSSANISGNFLKYTGGGIQTYYSDITVSDTTIIHSTSNYDYYIYSGSVNSIDTIFDESKVYFYGSGSVLDYSWYLDVNVLDANTNPIADANVSVKDSAELQIFNGSTDAEGRVRNIVAAEYRQTSAGKTYYNPHNISAEFNGTSNYVTSNIDINKVVTVFLAVNQPLKITILAPANNSLFVQGDQIAFKALGFDPLDGILTGSAINWTSSIDGFIGSGESFSNSTLSTGVHQITAEATNSGGRSVTDSVGIELIGRADLTVENINWTPAKINEGGLVLFNASVRNVGDGYTPALFYVRFYIDDDYLGQTQIACLNASELQIVTQTWLATASARNVTVVADYYNSIQEIDELNNRLTAPLTEINQSDLTVTGLTYTPDIFYDGMQVTFDAEIRNIGVSNANKSFEVGFYVNGTKIGTGAVNSLTAGASINVSSNWTAVPGSYDLSVKADDTNTIFESNESNNIMILNLPVVEQSDLTVSNITWTPYNFTEGEVVTFDAVIANIGDVPIIVPSLQLLCPDCVGDDL